MNKGIGSLRKMLTLFSLCLVNILNGQTDIYNNLKTDYGRFIKEERYDSALIVAKQMYALVLQIETDTSLRYAIALQYIGKSFYRLQHFDSSKFYYEKALILLKSQNRSNSIEYTENLNTLGIVYQNLGEFKNAENNYLKAIEIRNKFPLKNGSKSKYLNNLGFLYLDLGLFDEAESSILLALNRFSELYGADSSKYIYAIHSLAMVYHKKGDYEKANEQFVKWHSFYQRTMFSKLTYIENTKDFIINDLNLGFNKHAGRMLSEIDTIIANNSNLKKTHQYGKILFARSKFEILNKRPGDAENHLNQCIEFLELNKFTINQEYFDAHIEMSALLLKQEKLPQAKFFSQKVLKFSKEVYGIHHPNYAICLRHQAKLFMTYGFYKDAVEYLLIAHKIMEEVLGESSKVVNDISRELGIAYRNLGLYKSSEYYALKVLNFQIQNADKLGESFALNSLGYLYIDYDKLELAEELITKALKIRVEKYGLDTMKYYSVIHSLAKVNCELGLYDEANIYFNQWWSCIKNKPNLTPSKTQGLLDMVDNFMRNSRYREAEIYLGYADSILGKNSDFMNSASRAYVQKVFGDLSVELNRLERALDFYKSSEIQLNNLNLMDGKEFAEVMKGLSRFYLQDKSQDLQKSLDYIRKAAGIQLKILGPQHTEYANTLNSIGLIYSDMAIYDSAMYYYNLVLNIKRIALGEDHISYANTLNNIAVVYELMGDYDKVLPYYEKVLKIKKDNHVKDLATIYCNLASQYSNLGGFKDAEEYYLKGLEIRKEIFDATDPRIAAIHSSLGKLYMQIADFKNADNQFILAGQIWSKRNDNSSEGFASFLLGQAMLFVQLRDSKSAVANIKRALFIYESIKGMGKGHPKYVIALNDLGRCYLDFGNYREAEECFLGALKIRLNSKQINYYTIAKSYRNLGELAFGNSEYLKADTLLKRALKIADSLMGPESILSISVKVCLAKNYYAKGEFGLFLTLAEDIMRIKMHQISRDFEWFNDYQREAYWRREKSFFEFICRVASNGFEMLPQLSGLSYNATLILKAQLLEAKISKDAYLGEVEQCKEDISVNRKLLVKMESEGIGDKFEIERINRKTDSLDNVLSRLLPGYLDQKRNLAIRWENVQHNLEIGEVAIEFVRTFNAKDSFFYYDALILSRGQKFPQLVKLCREVEISKLVRVKNFAKLYDLVWRPLEPFLQGIKEIYYSPSGELYNIPFHALYSHSARGDEKVIQKTKKNIEVFSVKTANANYLIDRFTLHQLTSTRYLAMGLKQKAKEPISMSIIMVGGVNYDFLSSKEVKPQKPKAKGNSTRSSQYATGKLEYLAGTKGETETIKDSLQNKKWKIDLFSSNDATEDNLVRLEGRHAKSILHIATHGYTFPEYNFKDTTIYKNSLHYSYRYSSNPMVRSGLILAGGNWAWTGSDTLSKLGAEQNGILTALEVSQLNLVKTKLVVLSACQTGLGEIEGSEGTFGLKRGFKLAGVEQMIVSLWAIPDKETMELMVLFYSDLIKTLNPVLSFEKAQKGMRNKYPNEPEKWAGFVLIR